MSVNASIDGIQPRAVQSLQMAQNAVSHSARSDENIRSLSHAVSALFVSLISQIAELTNLLALNATIEAARR
jgi:methyl-accepting chemotaxis protein